LTVVLSLPLAFLAGILTILSPCVLPLAPIVIAGARAHDPRGPLALALGLSLTFGVGGGLLASLGIEFGAADWVRAVSAALMLAVGIVMIVPTLGGGAERWLAPVSGLADAMQSRLPAAGSAGQAAMGIVLAFAWAPCAGPTLGAAFALAANGGSLPAAMTIMTTFALGAACSLLVAGYGLGRIALSGRRVAGRAGAFGRATLGIAFVLVGAAILTGADHAIEAAFISKMPDWLVSFATQL
jgi:cytochrome c-type biogenesis protein